MTVTQIESATSNIVKRRYFPSNGTTSDVAGIISASSKKNTVKATRIETDREILDKI